jgi:uncharacterized membrane protein YoaK (UPF0700 family)
MSAAASPGGIDEAALRRAARSVRHPLTRALLVLTFTTGLVDAVSYLGLGRVFAANMTGNIVLLGFGIAGGTGLPVLAPLVSLASFLLGSVAGGRLALHTAGRPAVHVAWALALEVSLTAVAAIVVAVSTVHAGGGSADLVIALLAFAMGIRNATVRRIGVPDLTTTVLTMTLTGLAADSPPAGGTGAGSVRRLAAVAAMLLGALAGALLLKTSLVLPLVATAGLALATWLIYIPAARRHVMDDYAAGPQRQ